MSGPRCAWDNRYRNLLMTKHLRTGSEPGAESGGIRPGTLL